MYEEVQHILIFSMMTTLVSFFEISNLIFKKLFSLSLHSPTCSGPKHTLKFAPNPALVVTETHQVSVFPKLKF